MLDKNVCPKCGQLYSVTMQKCPLCGAAAPVPDCAPVQRQRVTEEDRRQRRSRRRLNKRRRKAKARAKKREEELFLQAEEERTRQLKKAGRSGARQPSGMSAAREQEEPAPENDGDSKDGKIPPAFTAISAVILVLAALIGISFFLWKSGKLSFKLYDRLSASATANADNTLAATASPTQETPPASTEPSGLCEGITLSAETLEIEGEGESRRLGVTLEPEDCMEEVLFSSDNAKAAVVDETGTVTAVGPGYANITVTCGGQSAVCKVSCIIELELNNPDMTFFSPGESFTLKVTNADPDAEVTWVSEDESIAKVSADGRVEAVSEGTVYVTATIGDSTGRSIVRCRFD